MKRTCALITFRRLPSSEGRALHCTQRVQTLYPAPWILVRCVGEINVLQGISLCAFNPNHDFVLPFPERPLVTGADREINLHEHLVFSIEAHIGDETFMLYIIQDKARWSAEDRGDVAKLKAI